MTSLVLRRDLSLEVPKLLVAAVQPYQTLAGPALTTSFLHQPELLPFQAAPFHQAAIAPLYFHTLLHTLAEFAETPRTVQHSHVKQQHAPKADFWDAVGTLNCFYYSAQHLSAPPAFGAAQQRRRSAVNDRASGGERRAAQHPAMGAVELVRPSHRRESDVKLTLFNSDHQAIASMLMTGPKNEGPRASPDDAPAHPNTTASAGSSGAEYRDGSPRTATIPAASRRTPLPYEAPPTTSSEYATGGLDGAADVAMPSAIVVGGTRVFGGLYGGVVVMKDGGGYAHRAFYWTDDDDHDVVTVEQRSATPTPAPSQASPVTAGETAKGSKDEEEMKRKHENPTARKVNETRLSFASPTVMPPWVLYDAVQRFFAVLHDSGFFGSHPDIAATDGWRLVSHHVVQVADAVMGRPCEIVSAMPRVEPQYRLPPWRTQLGLPVLGSGAVPCVSLRCEVRQDGQLMSTGVYFFCRFAEQAAE